MPAFSVSRLLVLLAPVLFLLAAFHVGLGAIDLLGLGLAAPDDPQGHRGTCR